MAARVVACLSLLPTHSLIPIPTKAITEAVAPVIKPIQMTSGEGKQVPHLFGRLRKT